mmetsp:Transcript_19747/g.31424  ORF Transcript_19747/g.31424 Transcript_19747/m.31424 type:complete len:211 (+) Transcript_19747:251-883(+)
MTISSSLLAHPVPTNGWRENKNMCASSGIATTHFAQAVLKEIGRRNGRAKEQVTVEGAYADNIDLRHHPRYAIPKSSTRTATRTKTETNEKTRSKQMNQIRHHDRHPTRRGCHYFSANENAVSMITRRRKKAAISVNKMSKPYLHRNQSHRRRNETLSMWLLGILPRWNVSEIHIGILFWSCNQNTIELPQRMRRCVASTSASRRNSERR